MRNKLLVSIASAALLAAPAALAQSGTGTTPAPGTGTAGSSMGTHSGADASGKMDAPGNAASAADADILEDLHMANHMEIDMGKLGKSHGSSKAVKDFADQMVKDHTAADKEVMAHAKSAKIDIKKAEKAEKPERKAQMKEGKDTMDRLKKLKGADFDKEFMSVMASDHQKVISMVTDAQSKVTPGTGALLTKMLPTLQGHMTKANELKDTMGK